MSATPTGRSSEELTVTLKLSEAKDPQLESLAKIVIVAVPLILST
jgi:hypothetical protein